MRSEIPLTRFDGTSLHRWKLSKELRGFHNQIDKVSHEMKNQARVCWLVRHRNWFVQQNKNPSVR